MKQERKGSDWVPVWTIFVTLLVDLLGFTVILPLLPSMLEYYGNNDDKVLPVTIITRGLTEPSLCTGRAVPFCSLASRRVPHLHRSTGHREIQYRFVWRYIIYTDIVCSRPVAYYRCIMKS